MKRRLILIILLLFSFVLTGCSSFFGSGEESLIISSIEREEAPNEGGFYIVVTYANEEKTPDRFFVPNGEKGDTGESGADGEDGIDGAQGVGIKDIVVSYDKETRKTTIKVFYDDDTKEPVTEEIDASLAIDSVEYGTDEKGNTILYVVYSDGNKSPGIKINKGTSLISYDQTTDPKTGNTNLIFNFGYKDGDKIVIVDTAKFEVAPIKGDTGRGIKSIILHEGDTENKLIIEYTDKTTDELTFARANKWFTGAGDPRTNPLIKGIIGDFYYDTYYNQIWLFKDSGWEMIIDIEEIEDKDETTVVVNFNLNTADDPFKPATLDGKSTVYMAKGSYFGVGGNAPLPEATREGYTFKGWYLVSSPGTNNSQFTDTTPVTANITLYACWELK